MIRITTQMHRTYQMIYPSITFKHNSMKHYLYYTQDIIQMHGGKQNKSYIIPNIQQPPKLQKKYHLQKRHQLMLLQLQ